jgi:hypothetical protein
MNRCTIPILAISITLVGCASHTPEQSHSADSVPVIKMPPAPTPTGEVLQLDDAIRLLGFTTWIQIVDIVGFDDGGTIIFTLADNYGNILRFKRGPWVNDNPTFSILEGQKEIPLKPDEARYRAIQVVLLHWIDRKFSPAQQQRIRWGELPREEGFAYTILKLFRPEEDE